MRVRCFPLPHYFPMRKEARYTKAMEAVARQRQQTYDDGTVSGEKGPTYPPPTTPPDYLTQSRPSGTGQKATGTPLFAGRD